MAGETRERLLRRGDYIWGSFIKPERVDGYVVGVNPGDRTDLLGRFPFSESSVDDAVACVHDLSRLRRDAGKRSLHDIVRKFRLVDTQRSERQV